MLTNIFYKHRILLLITLFSALISILRFNSFQVGAFYDDAYYIVLSESLATGHGYSLINFPNAHLENCFPPGWPLLLSLISALFPGNYDALKLLPLILWLASIVLIYRLLQRRIGTPYLEILVGLIAVNPALIGISGMLMSEAAYIFFTLLTLNLFEYWMHDRERGDWILLIVAFTTLYTQTIRTIGLAIVLAILFYFLLKRRFRQFVLFLLIVAAGLIFQTWFNSQRGGGVISNGYMEQVLTNLSPLVKAYQMWMNLESYSNEMILNTLIPVFGENLKSGLDKFGLGFIPTIANIGVLFLILLGIVLVIRNYNVSDLYIGFYFLGILSFCNPETGSAQSRFLLPIVPFLYFYLFTGVIWILHRIFHLENRRIFAIVFGVFVIFFLLSTARNFQDWKNPVHNRMTDISIGRTWLRENSPSDAIVMTRNPVPDFLYLRRRTVMYPETDQNINDYIDDNDIDYVILSPKLQATRTAELDDCAKKELLPQIRANPGKFALVYENSAHGVLVYKVDVNK